jgi:hypothetical protein
MTNTRRPESARAHELKVWPQFFDALLSGEKTFEARRNDRDFRVGDSLLLREWSELNGYSGRELTRQISYVLVGQGLFGVEQGYAVLALAAPEPRAAETGWQPIVTAPKDRSWFLAWDYDGGFYVFRDGPGFIESEGSQPTHWMPLPPSPQTEAK